MNWWHVPAVWELVMRGGTGEGDHQERLDEMELRGFEWKKSSLPSLPSLPTLLALFDGYARVHLSSTCVWDELLICLISQISFCHLMFIKYGIFLWYRTLSRDQLWPQKLVHVSHSSVFWKEHNLFSLFNSCPFLGVSKCSLTSLRC